MRAPRLKAVAETSTELLAVQVPSERRAADSVDVVCESEPMCCRVTALNGRVLEADRWPAVQWLTALMGGAA